MIYWQPLTLLCHLRANVRAALKSYFSELAKQAPISNQALDKATEILKNKIKLKTFKEESFYDLTEKLNLDEVENYAKAHSEILHLQGVGATKFKNYITEMAGKMDKGSHNCTVSRLIVFLATSRCQGSNLQLMGPLYIEYHYFIL